MDREMLDDEQRELVLSLLKEIDDRLIPSDQEILNPTGDHDRDYKVRRMTEALTEYGLVWESDGCVETEEDEARFVEELGEDFGGLVFQLRRRGEQFVAREGRVPLDVLHTLPDHVDDLDAAEAFLRASRTIVEELGAIDDPAELVEYVRSFMPDSYAAAVDDRFARRMRCAAIALTARLAENRPAACVAEEVVGVFLIARAQNELTLMAGERGLSEQDIAYARHHVTQDIFTLFDDSDVLFMFEEPARDVAELAMKETVHAVMDVVDQRIGAWFKPMWQRPAFGHLG